MPDDGQTESQSVPTALPTSLIEGETQAEHPKSSSKKRARKSNTGEERPNKRIKLKVSTSESANRELNGQNANEEPNETPKKRGRRPKTAIEGEDIAKDIKPNDSQTKDPTAKEQPARRGRLPKVKIEGESSKPKEPPKKKGKGSKAKENGPPPIPPPKWRVVRVLPTSANTTSRDIPETAEKPRIWFNSREEMLSTLPELTGPKSVNGLSWELYETPILLVDEENAAFQVKQDDTNSRFIDLVTTRTFVRFLSQKAPEPLPILAPTVPLKKTDPPALQNHPVVQNTPTPISIPMPNPEPDIGAYLLKMEPQMYRMTPETNDFEFPIPNPLIKPARKPYSFNEWATPAEETASAAPVRINFCAPLPTYKSHYANAHYDLPPVPRTLPKHSPAFNNHLHISSATQQSGQLVKTYGSHHAPPSISCSLPSKAEHQQHPSASQRQPQQIALPSPKMYRSNIEQADAQSHQQHQSTNSASSALQATQAEHVMEQREEMDIDDTEAGLNQATNLSTSDSHPALRTTNVFQTETSTLPSTNKLKPSERINSGIDLVPKIEHEDSVSVDAIGNCAQGFPQASDPTPRAEATQEAEVSQAANATQPTETTQAPEAPQEDQQPAPPPQLSEATQAQPKGTQEDQQRVPTPLPQEIQAIIDAYLFGMPLTLIASHGHLLSRWSLLLPKEVGYVMMGYFKVIGIQETCPDSMNCVAQTNELQPLSRQIQWLFRLQWRPGGEEFILPKRDPQTLEYPWWLPPSDTKGTMEDAEEGEMPEKESEAPADGTKPASDPEDEFPTTSCYRQARLVHHEYEFRHDHYRLLYESLLPTTLLAPFGPLVLDSAFPRGWLCQGCGRVNYQAALRHRICTSSACKGKPSAVKPYKVSLFAMRDPQDRLPIAHPYNTYPRAMEPKISTHATGAKTISYPLNKSGSSSITHIFTGNFGDFQKQATALLDEIQLEVELKRPFNDSSPYFVYSAKAPRTIENPTETLWPNVPNCLNDAKVAMYSRTRACPGLQSSRISINRLTVLAWITSGVRKGPEILRAKGHCVAIVAFGCDVVLTLTPRSLPEPLAVKKMPIDNDASLEPAVDTAQPVDLVDPVIAQQETTATSSSKIKSCSKAEKPAFVLYIVHGDCVVLDGDDFEYTIKRDGTSFLLIASHEKA